MNPRDGNAAAVTLDGITKRWNGLPALDGVSLHVAAGSFCVLLGPSGCGKTTLLRIVAGLEAADGGRVLIGGRDVTALPPAERGLAMVFQSYALFPHLSVAENIVFGLRARGVPPPERAARLRDAAGMLGLDRLLDRKPAQLSGGQQQRVALGRAVVARAPVCLMDEPLSNLDALLRAEMRREIHALQRRLGITMIYVTHDQTEAMAMADQVVLLRAGHKEADAGPAALYDRPPTAFAASFVGTPPMNLVPLADLPAVPGLAAPGGTALVGLRPEALRVAPEGGPGLPSVLRRAEYLGAETVAECRLGAHALLARLPGAVRLAEGEAVRLCFDPAQAHFFAATGERLEAVSHPEPVRA